MVVFLLQFITHHLHCNGSELGNQPVYPESLRLWHYFLLSLYLLFVLKDSAQCAHMFTHIFWFINEDLIRHLDNSLLREWSPVLQWSIPRKYSQFSLIIPLSYNFSVSMWVHQEYLTTVSTTQLENVNQQKWTLLWNNHEGLGFFQ